MIIRLEYFMKRKHSASYQCPDFKIVLIGEVAVGKSCLMQRFTREQYYPEHIPTVGMRP
jgi:GTPase SAR1 family protein